MSNTNSNPGVISHKNYVIFAQIKNEHKYLRDWIQYHFNIGFERIYLVEDSGSESHEGITAEFGDRVVLMQFDKLFPNNTTDNHQRVSFNWFIKEFGSGKSDIDWCAFIDVDEYIETEVSLDELFSWDVCGLYLYWKCWGANDRIHPDPALTLKEQYVTDKYFQISDRNNRKFCLNMKWPSLYPSPNVHTYPYCVTTEGNYPMSEYIQIQP